jgi:ABC-type nitrate/sulfonate/bicarbonate transport system substrate-binding protein
MTVVRDAGQRELSDADARLWITRCAVPTAVGFAVHLGWFEDEFAPDGVQVDYLPYLTSVEAQRRHYDHQLTTILREGGNIPAIWTRSKGEPTRLIGLTWIDERQVIVGRSDERIGSPAGLKGKRIGVPLRRHGAVDVFRGMALQGFSGALASVGLSLDDAILVDVPAGTSRGSLAQQWDPEFEALTGGDVDAIYGKGAVAVDAGHRYGTKVLVDLDEDVAAEFRVNNGTPRPITAHQSLLDSRPDHVERFLAVLLRAARWGTENPQEVNKVLAEETGADIQGAAGAYRATSLAGFEPTLSADRVSALTQQKDFLLAHGFLAGDFDVEAWVDEKPLVAAHHRVDLGN